MKQLHQYYPGIVLFIIALVAGCLVYRDYGAGWDEFIHRDVGNAAYDYIRYNNQTLKEFEFRNLGTGFELPLILLEKRLHLNDLGDITFMRHLATHIFFLIGALAGYVLALRLYGSRFVACLAFAMLVCHPRMYGHSYFNSKDIPFAACFPIFFLLLHIAMQKKKAVWYAAAGAIAGYATSIREMGLLLPACTGLLFIADVVQDRHTPKAMMRTAAHYLMAVVSFCVVLYIAWPLLWGRPLFYMQEEFKSLSHIHWGGDLIFNGETMPGSRLPFIYVPEWIAISTPELWVITGAAGLVWVVTVFVRNPLKFYASPAHKSYLMYVACFAIPIIVVYVLHSVNYDDWRHMYFVYPPFVFLSLYPVYRLYTGRRKVAVAAICGLQVALALVSLVQLHPFEQVYFNHFVSHAPQRLRYNFDMDYWGTSYRRGLQYVAAHDSRDSIRVSHTNGWIAGDLSMLPWNDRKRIILVDEGDPSDYYITTFRNHPQEYRHPNAVDSVQVLNTTIMKVFRMR